MEKIIEFYGRIVLSCERLMWNLFGYESKYMKDAWKRKAYRIQTLLDIEHRTNYAQEMKREGRGA